MYNKIKANTIYLQADDYVAINNAPLATTAIDIRVVTDATIAPEIGKIAFIGLQGGFPDWAACTYGQVKVLQEDQEGAGRLDLGIAARGASGALTPGLSVTSYNSGADALPTVGIGAAAGASQEAVLNVKSHTTDMHSWRMATNVGPEYNSSDPSHVLNAQDWTRGDSVWTIEDQGHIGVGADMTLVQPLTDYFTVGTGYIYGSNSYSSTVSHMNFSFDRDGVTSISQSGDMSNVDFAGKLCVIGELADTGLYNLLHVKNNTGSILSMGYTVKYFRNNGGM
jgi:hypothetical protein